MVEDSGKRPSRLEADGVLAEVRPLAEEALSEAPPTGGGPAVPARADQVKRFAEGLKTRLLAVSKEPQGVYLDKDDEDEKKRLYAAAKLLEVAGAEMLDRGDMLGPTADLDEDAMIRALLQKIEGLGGKSHTKADDCRKFISDVVIFRGSRGVECSLFPIDPPTIGDMMRSWREQRQETTAKYTRVVSAVEMLSDLKCRVSFDPASVAVRPVFKAVQRMAKAKARACPPPLMIVFRENWALAITNGCGVENSGVPSADFQRHSVVRMRMGGRGADIVSARFLTREEIAQCAPRGLPGWFAVLVINENKAGCRNPLVFVPMISLTISYPADVAAPAVAAEPGPNGGILPIVGPPPGPGDDVVAPPGPVADELEVPGDEAYTAHWGVSLCRWMPRHAAHWSRRGFMCGDFIARDGNEGPAKSGQPDIRLPCKYVYEKDEHGQETDRLRYCESSKAKKAMEAADQNSSGFTKEQLQELNLSGTHGDRKLIATVVELTLWHTTEIGLVYCHALGTWKNPADVPQGSARQPPEILASTGQPRRGRKPSAKASARESYNTSATMFYQVQARTKFARMMQTAFRLYGEKNITWETTWLDLFPADPPAELKRYYGPHTFTHIEVPSVRVDADISGVEYATGKAPRRCVQKRTRSSALDDDDE